MIDDRGALVGRGDKLPEEARQGTLGFDETKGTGGIVEGGLDLAAMADNGLVLHQALDIGGAPLGDARDVKAGEGPTEALALAQDGEPREA